MDLRLGNALEDGPHSSFAQGGLAPARLTVTAAARVPNKAYYYDAN